MSGFKGTKGPWVHRQYLEGQNSVRTLDDTRKICVPRVHNREESDANMLLISKAPEMLEMLEKISDRLLVYSLTYEDDELGEQAKELIKSATEL